MRLYAPARSKFLVASLLLLGLACNSISSAATPTAAPAVPSATPTVPPPTATPVPPEPPAQGWIAFVNQNNVWLIHPDGKDLTAVTDNPVPTDSKARINDIGLQWSPDGQVLAISHGGRLYGYHLATGETTVLVEKLYWTFDWSPDGKGILHDAPDGRALWVTNVETGDRQQLLEAHTADPVLYPQWSPDKSRVLVYDMAGATGVMRPGSDAYTEIFAGGKETYESGLCNWSPTEPRIACMRWKEQDKAAAASVMVLDEDGNALGSIELPETGAYARLGDWSPDGKQVLAGVVSRQGQALTYIVSVDTGAVRKVGSGAGVNWSPDGKWIVAEDAGSSSDPNRITVFDAETGTWKLLARGFYTYWQPVVTTAAAGNDRALFCTSANVLLNKKADGDHFLEYCLDNKQARLGPVEAGAVALGPNGQFFVYATNNGMVYAARVGASKLTLIGKVTDFAVVRYHTVPQYEFDFMGNKHDVRVVVSEKANGENRTLLIPYEITEE